MSHANHFAENAMHRKNTEKMHSVIVNRLWKVERTSLTTITYEQHLFMHYVDYIHTLLVFTNNTWGGEYVDPDGFCNVDDCYSSKLEVVRI